MLFADLQHDLVRSYCASGEQLDPERWRALFTAMADEGRRTLASEGARPEEVELRYSADLRYLRQIHELNLPMDESLVNRLASGHVARSQFDALHERLVRLPPSPGSAGGGQPARPVRGPQAPAGASARPGGRDGDAVARRWAAGLQPRGDVFPGLRRVPRRDRLDGGCRLQGPAIIELPQTTLVVPSNFSLHLDEVGSFVLTGSARP